MPLTSLFRQEAIDHKSTREPIDRVAQVTVPYDWLVLLLLAAVCSLAVLWAAFVKVELTLPVNVMVVKPTDDRIVESPITAHVSDVLVGVGSIVTQGDELIRVAVPDLDRRLAEAQERERIIREESELLDNNDARLNQMLIESRVEVATLSIAIAQDEVILSPYSGEVVEMKVATGQIAILGQEILSVRVSESADTFAIAFVPQSQVETLPNNAEAVIRCPGLHDTETVSARLISEAPQNMVESNVVRDADFDPGDHLLSLILSTSETISNGTKCEGHISLNPQTPMNILLGTIGGASKRG